MSPARREAVWAADAAIGVATAETAAPDATSRRVNVPGLMSGNDSQFFCERAAVFAAARSKTRRGIFGSLVDRCGAPKDGAAAALGISRTRRTYKTTLMAEQPLSAVSFLSSQAFSS